MGWGLFGDLGLGEKAERTPTCQTVYPGALPLIWSGTGMLAHESGSHGLGTGCPWGPCGTTGDSHPATRERWHSRHHGRGVMGVTGG